MTTERTDYKFDLISKAIRFLYSHSGKQPSLADVAGEVGVSEFHLQRMFVEWAGVSPKEFVQILTLERAKQALLFGESLVNTTFEVGLSSPSRLHELFLSIEAKSPGEFKYRGKGLQIQWDIQWTPFGSALFAQTDRGLCRISFVDDRAVGEGELSTLWPNAQLAWSPVDLIPTVEEVVNRMTGSAPRKTMGLLMAGSPFRIQVWQALLQVRPGSLATYSQVAALTGNPGAVRASASSTGENPLAFLLPCHRVIRNTGVFGEYRWGADRKLAMIGKELAVG